jgi:hypothetical protein
MEMREFVGVKPRFGFDPSTLKRDALIFERIAVPQEPTLMPNMEQVDRLDIPEWMIEEGMIFEPQFSFEGMLAENEEFVNNFDLGVDKSNDAYDELTKNDELARIVYQTLNNLKPEQWEEEAKKLITDKRFTHLMSNIENILQNFFISGEYRVRAMSVQLNELDEMDARPILNMDLSSPKKRNATSTDIVQIVINALPIPDDSVSWEAIRDYRADPDSQRRFSNLRRWMRQFAAGAYTPSEAKEEIESLLNEYEAHIKRQRRET